jgi:hypothetical protein
MVFAEVYVGPTIEMLPEVMSTFCPPRHICGAEAGNERQALQVGKPARDLERGQTFVRMRPRGCIDRNLSVG